MTDLLNIALDCTRRGWHVFPCWPQTKKPMTRHGWKDATLDEVQIRNWWTKTPDANVAIACNPSQLAVMDVDHGCHSEEDVHRIIEALGTTQTYIVRTGRRPEFGVQLYFNGSMPDVGLFCLNGWEGQIKSLGGYVMAAGSIHPDSKMAYEVLMDGASAPLPDVVRSLKSEHSLAEDDGQPITENRNIQLTSIAGKLRNAGLSKDALEVALLQVNQDRCEPPLDDEEVMRIASSVARYPIPEPEPEIVFGSAKKAALEVVEDADMQEEAPRPRYPDEVWSGTPYGEFADLCSAGNYIPKKLFSESMRTVVGAMVGDRLRCPLTGVTPRAYTIKIGPPGSGKGTSDEYVRLFFAERWEGLMRTESSLIWTDPSELWWRGRGIGAQIVNPASGPGLIKAIETPKLKKGETVNPLEAWSPMPRIITMSEEVRSLFANFANESTGAGLESVLCELFDRDSFTSTATKDRGPASGKLMYSLLGGITKEGWDTVFSKVQSTDSGFLSRVNIVGTEECRTVAGLKVPDFEPLRNRFLPLIQDLEKNPRTVDTSPGAAALMDRWFSHLELPEGISRARLNVHAWRTATHLAWLHGHRDILEVDVDGGIKVAEYQARMREFYAPPEGETRAARCEAAIRKVMRARKKVSVRELRRKTNSSRYGIGLWDRALSDLVKAREIRLEEGEKGRKTVILLKQKD